MLRAVGMSRRQVRRLVRYESVITALIGAILGTILGVIFAALVSRPLADEGFELAYPIGTLIVLLVAGRAGRRAGGDLARPAGRPSSTCCRRWRTSSGRAPCSSRRAGAARGPPQTTRSPLLLPVPRARSRSHASLSPRSGPRAITAAGEPPRHPDRPATGSPSWSPTPGAPHRRSVLACPGARLVCTGATRVERPRRRRRRAVLSRSSASGDRRTVAVGVVAPLDRRLRRRRRTTPHLVGRRRPGATGFDTLSGE